MVNGDFASDKNLESKKKHTNSDKTEIAALDDDLELEAMREALLAQTSKKKSISDAIVIPDDDNNHPVIVITDEESDNKKSALVNPEIKKSKERSEQSGRRQSNTVSKLV